MKLYKSTSSAPKTPQYNTNFRPRSRGTAEDVTSGVLEGAAVFDELIIEVIEDVALANAETGPPEGKYVRMNRTSKYALSYLGLPIPTTLSL
jgi:hypothetical protein